MNILLPVLYYKNLAQRSLRFTCAFLVIFNNVGAFDAVCIMSTGIRMKHEL
jgi:hypothetical protein